MQLFGEGDGFFCVVHIRFGDHFNQRCAGPVEINASHAKEILVQGLAGIFFKVSVMNAHSLGLAVLQINVDIARADNRAFQLGGLVALGQIRVEVVLPLEYRTTLDLGVHCQTKHHRIAESLLVGHRQRAGHGQVNGIGLSVGLGAVSGAGAGKNLGLGGELNVNFQPDHNIPLHTRSPVPGLLRFTLVPVGHLLELMGGVQQAGFGEIVPDYLQAYWQTVHETGRY